MTLGEQLHALRKTAKFTQEELAEVAEIGRTTISAVENDVRPTTTDVVLRWIEACGGVLQITHRNQAPDPLVALSPEERAVLEAIRSAHISYADVARLAGVAHALGTADGLARDFLVGQVDAMVAATQKSSGSEAGEQRRAV